MMVPSRDVFVTYGSAYKRGYYEISLDGKTLARRVELPDWIDDSIPDAKSLLQAMKEGRLMIPYDRSHTRQGHIYWNPDELEVKKPAVGVDREVFDRYIRNGPVLRTVFHIYKFGPRFIGTWRLVTPIFKAKGVTVQTSLAFAPQVFVPVTILASE